MIQKLTRDKHSSLVRECVNYGQIKFYNIGTRRDNFLCTNTLAYFVTTILNRKIYLLFANTIGYLKCVWGKSFIVLAHADKKQELI